MIDYPANYHAGAANFAFADVHVETHAWKDPRTMPPPSRERELPWRRGHRLSAPAHRGTALASKPGIRMLHLLLGSGLLQAEALRRVVDWVSRPDRRCLYEAGFAVGADELAEKLAAMEMLWQDLSRHALEQKGAWRREERRF